MYISHLSLSLSLSLSIYIYIYMNKERERERERERYCKIRCLFEEKKTRGNLLFRIITSPFTMVEYPRFAQDLPKVFLPTSLVSYSCVDKAIISHVNNQISLNKIISLPFYYEFKFIMLEK